MLVPIGGLGIYCVLPATLLSFPLMVGPESVDPRADNPYLIAVCLIFNAIVWAAVVYLPAWTMLRLFSPGIWQFISATARRYGLHVGGKDDERLAPVRSAEAAATMLAELHDEFGDWRLAAAAYNAGADPVRRAIAAQGTKDPAALAKSGAISRYASAVMAAALLIHHPELLD